MPVSVDELSRHASVSRATAYRVLTDHPRVSERARKKVLRAVEELGYPRLRRRRSGKRGKRRGGYVVWDPLPNGVGPGAFFHEVYAAIETAMARKRRAVRGISFPLTDSTDDLPVDLFRDEIEGIFTVAFYSDRHLEALSKRWPLACLLSSRDIRGAVSLMPDYAGASMRATQLLLQAGHRRIGLVTGAPQRRNFSQLFTEGYAGALAVAGLPVDPQLIHAQSGNIGRVKAAKTFPLGVVAGRGLLARADRPTAIVARHDSMVGVLAAAAELNLRVPQDVSLVGFGTRKLAGELAPAMTSWCFSPQEMVDLALEMIKAVPQQGTRLTTPVTLFEGKSVRAV